MKQIVLNFGVGEIVAQRSPKILAKQITKLLEKDFTKELQKAKNELIWENQEEKLSAIFKNLM